MLLLRVVLTSIRRQLYRATSVPRQASSGVSVSTLRASGPLSECGCQAFSRLPVLSAFTFNFDQSGQARTALLPTTFNFNPYSSITLHSYPLNSKSAISIAAHLSLFQIVKVKKSSPSRTKLSSRKPVHHVLTRRLPCPLSLTNFRHNSVHSRNPSTPS